MRTRILKAGTERIIHVLAKNLVENKTAGSNLPVIAVRPVSNPAKYKVYRHVHILGPSTLEHTPENPVPGTDGRAVCVIKTSAALKVFIDDDQ